MNLNKMIYWPQYYQKSDFTLFWNDIDNMITVSNKIRRNHNRIKTNKE